MGLYDSIKIEYPLPDPDMQDHVFQTKDLNCGMDEYTITKDGELILHEKEWLDVPEEERPYYGKPEWENGFHKFIGSVKSIPKGDVKINHHGSLRFYNCFKEDEKMLWYEYEAIFKNGKLQEIITIKSGEEI
jgi:hypothetical protein